MSLLSTIQANSTTSTFSALTSSDSTGPESTPTGSVGTSTSNATVAASTSSDAQISPAAKIAANEAADNQSTYADLETNVRAEFDTQYQAAGTSKTASHNTPDVSDLSGRALAVVALDKDRKFSAQEILSAKTEINNRERSDLMSSVGMGSSNISGIAAYTKQMISTYNSISPEERKARGWTQNTMKQATKSLETINEFGSSESTTASSTTASLFGSLTSDSTTSASQAANGQSVSPTIFDDLD